MRIIEDQKPTELIVILVGIAMWTASNFLPGVEYDEVARTLSVVGLVVVGGGLCIYGTISTRVEKRDSDSSSSSTAKPLLDAILDLIEENPTHVGYVAFLGALGNYLSSPLTLVGPVFLTIYMARRRAKNSSEIR